MWGHYVYLHRKADNGEPFYVGKGCPHRGRIERAYDRANRNVIWRRTVEKHGLVVELVASCIDDRAAQEIEKAFIKEIGRRDRGLGPLVNLTDGGEGHAGIIVSDELRRKRSISSKGPRSPAWIAAIQRARKNGGNGGVVKKGDKLPDWWKNRIAVKKTGAQNPMYGKTGAAHPNSRKVRETNTGLIYDSVQIAAEAKGVKMKTLYNWLSGHRPNPTALEFA